MLQGLEKDGMNIPVNRYDAIEKLICKEAVRNEGIDIHPGPAGMLVILITKAVLREGLSSYKGLSGATKDNLPACEIRGKGPGIHWPLPDEDLSLNDFLGDELLNVIKKDTQAA